VTLPLHALLLVLVGLAACGIAPLGACTRVDVDVQRDGDTFRIEAMLFAPVAREIAWEVLTDLERMATFVPNVTRSRIVSQQGTRVVVAQRGVARFGPLAFAFESERAVELSPPHEIRSGQTKGNMRRLESVTRFVAVEGGTEIVYRVEVDPGAFFPAALTERFLVHEIDEQFAAIAEEMIRRQRRRADAESVRPRSP